METFSAKELRRRFHLSSKVIMMCRRQGLVTPTMERTPRGSVRALYSEKDAATISTYALRNEVKARSARRKRAKCPDPSWSASTTPAAKRCALCERTALYYHPITLKLRCAEHKLTDE